MKSSHRRSFVDSDSWLSRTTLTLSTKRVRMNYSKYMQTSIASRNRLKAFLALLIDHWLKLSLHGLLEYFKAESGDIAREKLDNIDDRLESEWRILEECYNQAMDPSGSLYPEQYFLSLTRDDPSSAYRSRCSGFSNMDSRTRGVSPSATIKLSFADVPRYLFRVYDSKSSGLNFNTVFASEFSFVPYGALVPKVNLLSLGAINASNMLYNHPERKNCFIGSSFGDVRYIEVARRPYTGLHCSYLCTGHQEIPSGAVRKRHVVTPVIRPPEIKLASSQSLEYDNGEYLSQGVIHHGGRSSVFSLQDLISSGLYELYPEFADQSAKDSWTNRVLEFRACWREECLTSGKEFNQACEIARGPMKCIDVWDAILLLLTFRKHHPYWLYDRWDASERQFPEPDEVCRFRALLKLAEDKFDSKLDELSSEEAKKDAHL
ncbi:hypothetical protein IWW34DRAFT_830317 [Fusarium oxysporum f. sp. albedinis]|nr:hypothetical protein IWW34DRAFT_830317 [Fusarium oxysporum f. sp. albedinis]